MLKSLFVNKAGMLEQQRRLDIAANNLANLNTIGYKKDTVFFHKLAEAIAESSAESGNSDQNRTPGASQVFFSMGALQHTDNPLDVAISGDGFFVVQGEEGNYYTRNGNFQLDGEGKIVTPDGFTVMTDGGALQVSGGKIRINEQGEITVNNQTVGRLRIVKFDNPHQLERVGNAYFKGDNAGEQELPTEAINLRPGFLELSNVEPIMEMVRMIEINREYELGQKTIHAQDQTLEKLINQAGRL